MIIAILLTAAVCWALVLVFGPSVRVLWRRRRELHSWWYAGRPR